MPVFEILNLSDAMSKASAAKGNRVAAEYQRYIDALTPGKAGRLQAAEGETLRALALRLRRAAKLTGKNVKIHKAGEELLFWLEGQRRRGRPRKTALAT
jgi:hypothetical protein